MKRILFLLFAFSILNSQFSIAQRIQFAESSYDFGTVSHSLPRIEHRFEFTNTGDEPLVITRALTSCSCVLVDYDKRPIAPGAKSAVTVIYEVNKKEPGVFYKVVEVYSNAKNKRNGLIIKGNAK